MTGPAELVHWKQNS